MLLTAPEVEIVGNLPASLMNDPVVPQVALPASLATGQGTPQAALPSAGVPPGGVDIDQLLFDDDNLADGFAGREFLHLRVGQGQVPDGGLVGQGGCPLDRE